MDYWSDAAMECLNHLGRCRAFRKTLETNGGAIILALRQRTTPEMSMRAVAREVGLSAPYLCDVIHHRRIMAPKTFIRLVRILKGE